MALPYHQGMGRSRIYPLLPLPIIQWWVVEKSSLPNQREAAPMHPNGALVHGLKGLHMAETGVNMNRDK